MADSLQFASNGLLQLQRERLTFCNHSSMLMIAGFYMAYTAMTDSAEAGLQSRISTFSGSVGGAAFGANRLGLGQRKAHIQGFTFSRKRSQKALSIP